jgi:hypothetical protein
MAPQPTNNIPITNNSSNTSTIHTTTRQPSIFEHLYWFIVLILFIANKTKEYVVSSKLHKKKSK